MVMSKWITKSREGRYARAAAKYNRLSAFLTGLDASEHPQEATRARSERRDAMHTMNNLANKLKEN